LPCAGGEAAPEPGIAQGNRSERYCDGYGPGAPRLAAPIAVPGKSGAIGVTPGHWALRHADARSPKLKYARICPRWSPMPARPGRISPVSSTLMKIAGSGRLPSAPERDVSPETVRQLTSL